MKGQYGEECNITACQKPNSAFWYNHFNHQYYCENCANRLNNDEFNKKESQNLLGHEMCTLEHNKTAIVGTRRIAEKELEEVIKELERPIIITSSKQTHPINNTKDSINLQEVTQNINLSGQEKRRDIRKQQRKNK